MPLNAFEREKRDATHYIGEWEKTRDHYKKVGNQWWFLSRKKMKWVESKINPTVYKGCKEIKR